MNDSKIVEQIVRHRQTRLYAAVVAKYSGMVLSKALCITHDKELAAEVAQQTFIKAYTSLDSWAGGESLGPWLSVISQHLAINMMNEMKRRSAEPITEDVPDDDCSEEHEERLEQLRKALQQLPAQDREMVRLHYFQNLKTDEVAGKMGLTQANVLVRLHRIRERLKTQIKA